MTRWLSGGRRRIDAAPPASGEADPDPLAAALSFGQRCLEDATYAITSAMWSVRDAVRATDLASNGGRVAEDAVATFEGASVHVAKALTALRRAAEEVTLLQGEHALGPATEPAE